MASRAAQGDHRVGLELGQELGQLGLTAGEVSGARGALEGDAGGSFRSRASVRDAFYNSRDFFGNGGQILIHVDTHIAPNWPPILRPDVHFGQPFDPFPSAGFRDHREDL
jgi:hypothetical protein